MRRVTGKRTESWWLYALTGALATGGPVWHDLFVSRYPVRPEVFAVPLAAAAVGAIIALGSWRLGGLLGTLAFGGLLFVFTDLQFDLHQWMYAAVLLAGCIGLAQLFASHRAAIASLALGAFYGSSLVLPAAVPRTQTAAPRAARSPRSNSPLLVHIILDEQLGVGGFRAVGDTATADFLSDFYQSRGFELFEAAYSRFGYTEASIPQSLALGLPLSFNPEPTVGRIQYFRSLRNNPYFERLRDLGYEIRVYQSTFLDLCREADAAVASCDVQSGNSIAHVGFLGGRWTTRALWLSRYFLNTRSSVYARLNPEPSVWSRSVAGGGLAVLQRLTKAIAAHHEAGTAFFVHVLLPHRPVYMDAECRVNDPADNVGYDFPAHPSDSLWQAALRLYAGQVRCAHRQLANVIDAVDSLVGRDRSIVIIQGDHGSRMPAHDPAIESIVDYTAEEINLVFSTLLAVRRPGVAAAIHAEAAPVQDVLWELARSDFAGPVPTTWQHYVGKMSDSSNTGDVRRLLTPNDMMWVRRPD